MLAFRSCQPEIQNHPVPVRAYPKGDQRGHPHALIADSHPRIPAVEKQVTNLQFAEIAPGPRGKVFAPIAQPGAIPRPSTTPRR